MSLQPGFQQSHLGPTIAHVIARFWPLILGGAIAGALLGAVYATTIGGAWKAEAVIEVADPRDSALFLGGDTNDERYVNSQIARLKSRPVADLAAATLTDDLTSDEIQSGIVVSARPDSNVIDVQFLDRSPDVAIAVVNVVVDAYAQVRAEDTNSEFSAALIQIEDGIANVEQDLARIEDDIDRLLLGSSSDAVELELADSFDDLETVLSTPAGTDPEAAEARDAEVGVLLERISILRALTGPNLNNPTLTLLLDRRRSTLDRLTGLVQRRDQLRVDSALSTGGLIELDRALDADRAIGVARASAAGLILGALIGLGTAYVLATARRRLETPADPSQVLGAPLLGILPSHPKPGREDEAIDSNDPVVAEATGIAAASLLASVDEAGVERPHIVVVTSTSNTPPRPGTTTELALALVHHGQRVLVVDGDITAASLSVWLLGSMSSDPKSPTPARDTSRVNTVINVRLASGVSVDLLPLGMTLRPESDVTEQAAIDKLLELSTRYDLVVVDSPGGLSTTFQADLLRAATHIVVVARHHAPVADLTDLAVRLQIVRTRLAGYLYDLAPTPRKLRLPGRDKILARTG